MPCICHTSHARAIADAAPTCRFSHDSSCYLLLFLLACLTCNMHRMRHASFATSTACVMPPSLSRTRTTTRCDATPRTRPLLCECRRRFFLFGLCKKIQRAAKDFHHDFLFHNPTSHPTYCRKVTRPTLRPTTIFLFYFRDGGTIHSTRRRSGGSTGTGGVGRLKNQHAPARVPRHHPEPAPATAPKQSEVRNGQPAMCTGDSPHTVYARDGDPWTGVRTRR